MIVEIKKKRIRDRKGLADLKRFKEYGEPVKYIKIPINTDIELIISRSVELNLIPDYTLFFLYKLLYNRQTCFDADRKTQWYKDGYSSVYSADLQYWLGHNYPKYISLLINLGYVQALKNDNGNIRYCAGEQTARYIIPFTLLEKEGSVKKNFKMYQLTNMKLINKLQKEHLEINNIKITKLSHQLLAEKVTKVKFNMDDANVWLEKNSIEFPVYDMYSFMDDMNKGNVHIKRDLDAYGERFHTSYTFTWKVLRKFMVFDDCKELSYSDIKNSQFFCLSILNKKVIKEIIPEFNSKIEFFDKVMNNEDYKLFIQLAQSGDLYEFLIRHFTEHNIFNLNEIHPKSRRDYIKKICMKVFFSSSKDNNHLKKHFKILFPSVFNLISNLCVINNENRLVSLLPEMLQKLESRINLDRVCIELIQTYNIENIISIHDGLIYNSADEALVKSVINDVYLNIAGVTPSVETNKLNVI